MNKIRKGDTVKVLTGKDKAKTGKVLKFFPRTGNAIVEGVNFVKKHVRRKREEEQAGIIQMEGPIKASNLAIICKQCNRPVRVGFSKLADGTKSRFCKKCNEMI